MQFNPKALTLGFSLTASIFGLVGVSQALAQAEADFYAGKTLVITNNFSAGGPTDTWARFHAEHIGRFIPGNPQVIVENRPGAAGIAGFQWLVEVAKPDGLTIGMLGGTLPRKEAQGEFPENAPSTRDATIIIGASDSDIYFGRAETFPDGIDSLLESRDAPFFFGVLGEDQGLRQTAALELLGLERNVDYKLVRGYPGGVDVYMAMQVGEVDMHQTSPWGYQQTPAQEVAAGNFVSLWQSGVPSLDGGIARAPNVPDIPTLHEVHQTLFGNAPSGPAAEYLEWQIAAGAVTRLVAVPPGTPEELVTILRTAWTEMTKDPEFLELQRQMFGSDAPDMSSAEEAMLAIEQVFDMSSGAQQFIERVTLAAQSEH